MKIKLKPGKYVAAVSGGVDSMVLLDLLLKSHDSRLTTQDLIVAHFDHGIRDDSKKDRDFVASKSEELGLRFVYKSGRLGPNASEAAARKARYEFLNEVKVEHDANAILTAHHRDDALETAIINLLRGSGRKGLSSLKSTNEVKRPLLAYGKNQITEYAKKQDITWREDPTNLDISYLRNYVRHKIVPRLSRQQKDRLLELIDSQAKTNQAFESLIKELLQLDRKMLIALPHNLAKEVIAEFLRSRKISFDSKLLEKSVVFAKTAKTGKKFEISNDGYFEIEDNEVKLVCYN